MNSYYIMETRNNKVTALLPREFQIEVNRFFLDIKFFCQALTICIIIERV